VLFVPDGAPQAGPREGGTRPAEPVIGG